MANVSIESIESFYSSRLSHLYSGSFLEDQLTTGLVPCFLALNRKFQRSRANSGITAKHR